MEEPKELKQPNFSALIAEVQAYIEYMGSEDYHEDGASDYEHSVFEAAIEAVYGPDVWKWVNDKIG